MILLIDSGNTRLKWRLDRRESGESTARGYGLLTDPDPLKKLQLSAGDHVDSVAVSTVASEQLQHNLVQALKARFGPEVTCHWAEAQRNNLVNGYHQPEKMGADRWHGMYAAWLRWRQGFVVVDAGSAVTVDYVAANGQHLGGFILPGLQMMLRSLSSDAARINFDPEPLIDTRPGVTTNQCVNNGLAWLGAAVCERIRKDRHHYGLQDVVLTGGDAPRLQQLGLEGHLVPELVIDGLGKIHREADRKTPPSTDSKSK